MKGRGDGSDDGSGFGGELGGDAVLVIDAESGVGWLAFQARLSLMEWNWVDAWDETKSNHRSWMLLALDLE